LRLGRSYHIATKRFALAVVHAARKKKSIELRVGVEPTALESNAGE